MELENARAAVLETLMGKRNSRRRSREGRLEKEDGMKDMISCMYTLVEEVDLCFPLAPSKSERESGP